ncbi:MAG: aminotransferase class V-fold PLP-dependent enzyme [Gemmatimonadaceae bacterium]
MNEAKSNESEREALVRWRSETPGCGIRVHLNNAGASLMPAVVKDAITAHLGRESIEGGYEAADAQAPAIADAYDAVARLIGAAARNIAIVPSATDGFALALSAFDFAPGDVILTSSDDYISNQLMYLSLAARRGVRVVRAPDGPMGGVDLRTLEELIERERPRLVALSWIPTNSGLVQPAAAVGALCKAEGVPYLLDACQAVGQMVVDVRELQCDYLATTARKFLRGPRGIGFLHVSDAALERGDHPLLVDMRGARWTEPDAFALVDDARRFENWEFAYALVLGLGAAAHYANALDLATASRRAHALAAHVRRRFGSIRGVRGLDRGERLSAIATFTVDGHAARDLVLALRERGINTSSQSRADALIDLTRKGAETLLRVSPHYFNTEDEIETAARGLEKLLG